MNISTLVGEYASLKAEASATYANLKRKEDELLIALKAEYPNEWADWLSGRKSLKADGVTVPVSREYNLDKLQAEFGEERPDLIIEKVIPERVVRKADGAKLKAMWTDTALARRLEKCILPPVPKVKI